MEIPKPKYEIGDKVWVAGFEIGTDPDINNSFKHKRIPVLVRIEKVMIFQSYKDAPWFVQYEVIVYCRHGCCLGFGYNPHSHEVLLKFLENFFEINMYDTEKEALEAIKEDDLPF